MSGFNVGAKETLVDPVGSFREPIETEDRVAVQITTKPNVIQRLLGKLVGIKWIVIQVAKDK